MRKSRVPYAPLAIDYWQDPALAVAFDANPLAEVMWTRLLSAAKKSKQDGYVPRGALIALGVTHWRKTMPLLVAAGVVEECEDGWRVAAWLKHNDTQEEIDAERDRKRANIAAWRDRKNAERAGSEPDTNTDATALVTGYETDHVPGTEPRPRHLTPDTRHLTPDSHPSDVLGCSSSASTKSKRRNAEFDAVTTELDARGEQLPGGTIAEIAKRVRATKRDPAFVVELTQRMAHAERVDLASCTAAERSRVLGAVGQIAALTDDIDEVARRARNASKAGERSIASALQHRWSAYDGPATATPQRSSAATRQAEISDRLVAEAAEAEAAGRTNFPSLRAIGGRP